MKRLPMLPFSFFLLLTVAVTLLGVAAMSRATDINSLNPCVLQGPKPTAPSKQLHAPKPLAKSKQPKVPTPGPLPTMGPQPFSTFPPPAASN